MERLGLRRRKGQAPPEPPRSSDKAPARSVQKASSLPLVFGVTVLIAVSWYATSFRLARAVEAVDVDSKSPFSTDRAMDHVRAIASQPHAIGSAEWLAAADYIEDQVGAIASAIDPASNLVLEVERFTSSGSHQISYARRKHMATCYNNVVSIIARIRPKDSSVEQSLLVNAHFDSATGAPGASDNGIGVGSTIETLRAMTSSSEFALSRPVIFLWNGGEEYILSGAHGFMSNHRWAPTVKAHINLEAMGTGSRFLLYQAGPQNGWLLEAYSRVVQAPYAQVTGTDVFESGVIPADTDYTIFAKANIPGLDLAMIDNGKVYHTKYDSIEFAKPAAANYLGKAVLLPLINELAGHNDAIGSSLRDSVVQKSSPVFFDVFGLFTVVCPERVANVLTIALLVWWLLVAGPILSRRGAMIVTASLGGMLVVLGGMTSFYSFVVRPMAWYFSTLLAVVMFAPPAIWGALVGLSIALRRIPNDAKSQVAAEVGWVSSLFYVVTTVLMLVFGKKSLYYPALVLLSYLISHTIRPYTPRAPLLHYILVPLPSIAFLCAAGLDLLRVLHGILGRAGKLPVDFIMAGTVSFFTVLCWVLPLLPFAVHHHEALPRLRCLFRAVIITTLVVVALIPEATLPHLHSSYSRDSPKRMVVIRHFQSGRQPETLFGVSSADPIPVNVRPLLFRLGLSENDTFSGGPELMHDVMPHFSLLQDWSVFDLDDRRDEDPLPAPTIDILSDTVVENSRSLTFKVSTPPQVGMLGIQIPINSTADHGQLVDWSIDGRPREITEGQGAFIVSVGRTDGITSLEMSVHLLPDDSSGSLKLKISAIGSATGFFSEKSPLSRLNLQGWMAPDIYDAATIETTL